MSEPSQLQGCYVYGIGQKRRECYGHGEFGDELAIRKQSTRIPGPYIEEFPPLFLTEKEVWSWIRKQNHAFDLEPVKLRLMVPVETWNNLFGGYENT